MASSSKAIIQWVAGILATVISSVLIYQFTRPPDPPTLPISIEGRVIDVSSSTLISDANVTLRAGKFWGNAGQQYLTGNPLSADVRFVQNGPSMDGWTPPAARGRSSAEEPTVGVGGRGRGRGQ